MQGRAWCGSTTFTTLSSASQCHSFLCSPGWGICFSAAWGFVCVTTFTLLSEGCKLTYSTFWGMSRSAFWGIRGVTTLMILTKGCKQTYSTVWGILWSSLTKAPLTGGFTICCWWRVAMIQWLCCLGCVFYSPDVHKIFLCTAHELMYVTEWKCMSNMWIWSMTVKQS